MHLMQTAFIYYAVLSMVEGVIGFNQRCPRSNEWNSRRKNCTSPDKPFYACLYNEFSLQYSENCTRKEYKSRKGKKGVFSPAISETDCADSRFQPIKFTTLSYSDCIYAKSTCSEEGQVLAKNGSSFVDRSCRCDYRKGYSYITQPKDKCSCTPSLEDCSCYLTSCTGNSALTQDYDCVLKIDSRSGSYVCEKILNGSPANATTNTNNTFIDKKEHSSSSSFTTLTSILIFMSIIVVSILMLWVSLSIRVMPHIVESKGISNGIIYIEEGIPKIYHHIEGDNFTITCDIMSRKLLPVKSVRWQKDGCNINLKSYKHELNDHDTSLTIENLSENDTGTYTCIVSNWLGFNNTSVDKCICHVSALHSKMTWIQTLHRFKACKREDQNRITVNVHKLPESWKKEEKIIGEEVRMDPSTDTNKELMKSLEFIKSVVWFHITKDEVRIVKQDHFLDVNDRYSKQGQQGYKHDGTFGVDQHGDTKEGVFKTKQQGDTTDGTVKADQHGDKNEGGVKAKQQGDANDETVKADQHGDTKDGVVEAKQQGVTNDGTVKTDQQGDTKDKTVKADQHGETKEGAVKAKQQGDANNGTVKDDEHGDTKDGNVEEDQQGDTKDGPVNVDQQGDAKDGPVNVDQQGDAKDEPVKPDEQGDTKDRAIKPDEHWDALDDDVKVYEDTKDGTGKADVHGDVKDGAVKHVIDDDGTWDRYAYTFNTTFSHTGQYVCFVVGNENIIGIGWRLKVIPEGSVYNEVRKHRNDHSYVKTSTVEKAMKILENNGFAVIVGREGTGKSKISLELASLCEQKDYLPFKVDQKSLNTLQIADLKSTKVMFIIDNSVYNKKELGQMLDQLSKVFNISYTRILFTCRHLQPFIKSTLLTNNLYNDEALIKLDNILTVDDKRKILAVHMKVNDIAKSKGTYILHEDNSKPVELSEDAVAEINKTEPFLGFPLMASNFCSMPENFKKGQKYFTKPLKYLVDEIRDLYQFALKNENPELMKQYIVLIYLATDEPLCFDKFARSASWFAQLKNMLYGDRRGVQYIEMSSIRNAADNFVSNNKYITKFDDQTYRFIHPYVSKAVFLSAEDDLLNYFIQNADVENIIEFVRSAEDTDEGDYLVKKLKDDGVHFLCERYAEQMTKNSDLAEKIGYYIYEHFIKVGDTDFLLAILLKFKCFPPLQNKSPTQQDIEMESLNGKDDTQTVPNNKQGQMGDNHDNKNQNRSKKATAITCYSPPEMIAMIEHLTRTGKDSWIYKQKTVPDLVVLYGLIAGCKNNFLSDAKQKKTFEIILKLFTDNLLDKNFRLMCFTPMDTFDNKFCHFLTLFNESESCMILKELIKGFNIKHAMKDTVIPAMRSQKNILKVKNIYGESPLQMSAYLGKAKLFIDFFSASKKKKEKKEKLSMVVKKGMEVAFVTQNFTDLNFDYELRKSIRVGNKKDYSDIMSALKN